MSNWERRKEEMENYYKKKKEINRTPLIGAEDDENLNDTSILITPEKKKKKKHRDKQISPRSVHFKEIPDIRRIPSRHDEAEEKRNDDNDNDDNDNRPILPLSLNELNPRKPVILNEKPPPLLTEQQEEEENNNQTHMGRAMKNIIKHKVPLIIIGSVIVIGIVVICIYFFLNRKKQPWGSSTGGLFLDPKTSIKEKFVKDEIEVQEISKRRNELNSLKKPLEVAKDKIAKDIGYLAEQLKKQPKRVDIPSPGEDDEQGIGEAFGDLNIAFQNPQAQTAKKNQIKGLMNEANKKYLEIEGRLKGIQSELDYIAKF